MTNPCSEQLKDWIAQFQEQLSVLGMLGASPWDQLMEDLVLIQEDIHDFEQSQKDISPIAYDLISPIERLGLGPKILSLYEGGLEAAEISNHLSVVTSANILPETIQNYVTECLQSGQWCHEQ